MIKKIFIWTAFVLSCSFVLSSCTALFTGLYGLKKLKAIDEQTIERYAKKYNIPSSDSYELDTSYFSFLFSFDTTEFKNQIKNHYQPLQALYFDKTGQLQSFQVNCYAGGFPNLKWNRYDIMTTFPPKQQAPLDTLLNFENQFDYLRPLSQTKSFTHESFDYIVVVYWSRFMGRQSKRLIKYIQNNGVLATNLKVKILYANTDNSSASE